MVRKTVDHVVAMNLAQSEEFKGWEWIWTLVLISMNFFFSGYNLPARLMSFVAKTLVFVEPAGKFTIYPAGGREYSCFRPSELTFFH